MSEIEQRLDYVKERLETSYDGIGHSSGRPYIYFIYPPEQDREINSVAPRELNTNHSRSISFYHIDLLPLTTQSLAGQENRRHELLNSASLNGTTSSGAAEAILRLWSRALSREITRFLDSSSASQPSNKPVIVLRGLAALHPIGNPTGLMEFLAEQEPRHPFTSKIVPIVLLVPGMRPPQSSRRYLFLGLERLSLDFYRGEEV